MLQYMKLLSQLVRLVRDVVVGAFGAILVAVQSLGLIPALIGIVIVGLLATYASEVVVFGMKIAFDAINGTIGVVNDLISGVRQVVSLLDKALKYASFGTAGSHTIPLPGKIDIDSEIPEFEEWPDMDEYCAPYNNPLRMLAFPFQKAFNDFMCPMGRYLYGTSLYPVYSGLFGFTYYDPTPYPGNNCEPEDLATLCFVLKLGHFILPYVIAFVIVITFLPKFWRAIRDALELAWTIVEQMLHIVFWCLVRLVRPRHVMARLSLNEYIKMVE